MPKVINAVLSESPPIRGPEAVTLADTTLGDFNSMGLGEQAEAVRCVADLSAFLNNWLCGPAASSTPCRTINAAPFLDSLAWAVSDLENSPPDFMPPEPTWGLFARLLFLAVFYDSPESCRWEETRDSAPHPSATASDSVS